MNCGASSSSASRPGFFRCCAGSCSGSLRAPACTAFFFFASSAGFDDFFRASLRSCVCWISRCLLAAERVDEGMAVLRSCQLSGRQDVCPPPSANGIASSRSRRRRLSSRSPGRHREHAGTIARMSDEPLHLVDATMFWSPTGGGVRRYLQTKHAWLAEQPRWRHTIAVPRVAGTSASAATLPSWPLPASGGYRLPVRRRAIAKVLVELRPDLIEAGDPYRVAWAALDAAR